MHSLKYLNTVLTVITILLALHLWTVWSVPVSGGGVVSVAQAAGIPNAGQQRKEIADEVRRMSSKVDELIALFRSGDARVRMWRSSNDVEGRR